jgi:hypothetical protein
VLLVLLVLLLVLLLLLRLAFRGVLYWVGHCLRTRCSAKDESRGQPGKRAHVRAVRAQQAAQQLLWRCRCATVRISCIRWVSEQR